MSKLKIGIDIGSNSIKIAIIENSTRNEFKIIDPVEVGGRPLKSLKELLASLNEVYDLSDKSVHIALTGSGASKVSKVMGFDSLPEIDALAATVDYLGEDIEQIIEIGAETQKYLSFFKDKKTGKKLLEEVIPGGKCAGGTGSFLDYMHKRLKYDSLEDFIETGLKVKDPAAISGRCAVFAESDIVHHYQKGTSRDKIVAGIHQAMARNFKSLIRKGTVPSKKLALVGGVAKNNCILRHIVNELELDEEQVYVPEDAQHMAAIGAAIRAEEQIEMSRVIDVINRQLSVPFEYEHTEPLKMEKSEIMDSSRDEKITNINVKLASLGVDIGSVSTKAAVISRIDGQYEVLAKYYRRTEGNPIEAVKDVLKNISLQLNEKNIKIERLTAATTGSGRYLTGYFIGANTIKDEITSQAAGISTFVKEKEVTVIEIGGQDSKFLRLRDGSIVDFEMNWACAAGTGALIEKHAKNLDIPITKFGDYALKGDKPPIINSTCAVFSEAALMYFQQNNVSLENLCAGACLASARNYVIKVVRNRHIGEKVAFQGAVAFNKGMVSAFETILNRPIIIPPYPHLTGAIGCARLNYESMEQNPGEIKFRGFETILNSEYTLSSFVCRKCGNDCNVNQFKVGNETFFQGDRCDRYSGIHKKSLGKHLPDLFQEWENILLEDYEPEEKTGLKTVGIPRGLLFNVYFPLYNKFFSELGFNIKITPATNKQIIRKGMESVVSEPCFPIKVAHGHVAEMVEQGVDFLFMPQVMLSESTYGDYEIGNICPYVQSGPTVIASALELDQKDVKVLNPVLFFDRGVKHLERKLIDMGKELGRKPGEIKKALKAGLEALDVFNKKVQQKGREVLEDLPDGQPAFVIIGRPYALFDPGVNMNVAKKVKDEGYLAIPFDMLPLKDKKYDPSDTWPNVYPVQGQKKMAAARFLKNHPNLHALVITYFGCGPDAFVDQMFYEELKRQYLTIQIDEHTSDTGILTRIQAHLSSAEGSLTEVKKTVKACTTPFNKVKHKKIWLPYMNEAAMLLAAAMRAHGIDAHVLPQSQDKSLTLARNGIAGDVCIPMLYTTQDMLEWASRPDFDPEKEAFFQGKSLGPCRFGLYYMLEKVLLEQLVGKPVDIVTIGNKDSDGGLGNSFLILAWDAMLSHDLLQKMLFHTRPYEVNQGESDRIFEKYVRILEKATEDPNNKKSGALQMAALAAGSGADMFARILDDARKEFQQVEVVRTQKPMVGIVGEYYVRQHDRANFDLIRTLEDMGCEVWFAPGTEFLGYSNYITGAHSEDKWKDAGDLNEYKDAQLRKMIHKMAQTHEHKLWEAVKPYMAELDDLPPDRVVEIGEKYVTRFFGGEAILSLGKSEDFARRGLDGIISVGPFNCMPSLVVAALSKELRKKFNKIPFLNIDFDGFEDNTREQRLSAFVSQAKERNRAKNLIFL